MVFRNVMTCSNVIVLGETAASIFRVEGGVKAKKTVVDITLRTSEIRSRNLFKIISHYCVSK